MTDHFSAHGIITMKQYSPVLDMIRIVAMLGVVAVHYSQHFPIPECLAYTFNMGQNGVQIFFALSAFLACSYFMRTGASMGNYYKRRMQRILPTYYAAIIFCIIFFEFINPSPAVQPDMLHLGWSRYFLGLQELLPSNNFQRWNNCCGFWCMTSFLVFYAIAPFIFLYVTHFKRAVVFLIVCLVLALITRAISKQISPEAFDEVRQFFKWSPLFQMQYFAIGILAFIGLKEKKIRLTCIIMGILALAYFKSAMMFAASVCIIIILFTDARMPIGPKSSTAIKFLSKYSFHVYLAHILALLVATYATTRLMGNESSSGYYACKQAYSSPAASFWSRYTK